MKIVTRRQAAARTDQYAGAETLCYNWKTSPPNYTKSLFCIISYVDNSIAPRSYFVRPGRVSILSSHSIAAATASQS